MTARIIPFGKRNTFAEYKRRRSLVLDAFWSWMSVPVIILVMILDTIDPED